MRLFPSHKHPKAPGGYILMEAIFALMLFGMCAVKLMQALAMSSKLAVETQMDSQLLMRLESRLTEFHKINNIIEWEDKNIDPTPKDSMGIWLTTSVTRIKDVRTAGQNGGAGQELQQLYRVYVQAFYEVPWRSEPEMVDAECWRYAPLYRSQGAVQNGNPQTQR